MCIFEKLKTHSMLCIKNKLIILLLLLAGSIQTKAQEYIPLLGDTNVWYIAERLEFGEIISYVRTTDGTKVINDTTYTWITGGGSVYYGLIRENTNEKKVYMRIGYSGNSGERLLYDFSKNEGEYVDYGSGSYLVDSIRYIETIAGQRKVWYLNGGGGIHPVWIEGIGSLAGILMPWLQPNLNWGEFPELLCCEYNEEPVYKSENGIAYDCDFSLYDQTPSVVDSIWYEEGSYSNTDSVTLYVKASDNLSGISYCITEIKSPSGNYYSYEGDLTHVEDDIYFSKIRYNWNEIGNWYSDFIVVYDNAGNEAVKYFDYQAYFYVNELNSVKENKIINIDLYPNPSNGIFNINLTVYSRPVNILITDMTGKEIYEAQITNNKIQVDLSKQAAGIYFIKLNNKEQTITQKIIVSH